MFRAIRFLIKFYSIPTVTIQKELVNSDIFAKAIRSGEKSALELAQQNVEFLSIGLNNVITFFDPEEVYINSSVYRKIPQLTKDLQQKLTSQFTQNTKIKTVVWANRHLCSVVMF